MSKRRSNVIVHVTDPLEPAQMRELARAVASRLGVERAQAAARAPRLLRVDYDPAATTARGILDCVLSQGYPARLIGM